MIPTLTTDRLTLRAPRSDDFEAYAAFLSSDRARTIGGPFSRAQAFQSLCALIGHWSIRGFGRWMVADRSTDAPLGIVGLFFPDDWPEPEIAWTLFDTAEGRGIAQEAAVASRAYAYDTLGWTRAVSLIDPANSRSVALAERLGCAKGDFYHHPTLGQLQYWHHPAPEALQ